MSASLMPLAEWKLRFCSLRVWLVNLLMFVSRHPGTASSTSDLAHPSANTDNSRWLRLMFSKCNLQSCGQSIFCRANEVMRVGISVSLGHCRTNVPYQSTLSFVTWLRQTSVMLGHPSRATWKILGRSLFTSVMATLVRPVQRFRFRTCSTGQPVRMPWRQGSVRHSWFSRLRVRSTGDRITPKVSTCSTTLRRSSSAIKSCCGSMAWSGPVMMEVCMVESRRATTPWAVAIRGMLSWKFCRCCTVSNSISTVVSPIVEFGSDREEIQSTCCSVAKMVCSPRSEALNS
mmetsp:Transcript_7205/g.13698  ORF Transcript_7205/g.13698 Transcript_7205/m.13698 type:complete len:288 (+) Transcript_7205:720-1583(+)